MKYAVLSMLLSGVLTTAVAAQSTEFTYQGLLKNGGALVSGRHDLRFSLFNAATAGNQVGVTVCADDVLVDEGWFSTTIDFGQRFATNQGRFLEIEVRRDTGLACGNTTGFTTLTPRQPITAAPMATHARSAFSLNASDGNPLGAVIVDNEGRVGIGTPAPTAPLHVKGPVVAENVGDQADLLWLASERSWVFRQEGTGAGTALKLQSIGGGGNKSFIVQTDGAVAIRTGGRDNFVPSGVENLRLVRGDVRGDGTILRGAGFTCRKVNAGAYEITFTPPFSGPPTVTLTTPFTGSAPARVAHYNSNSVTPRSVIVITQTPPGELPTDTDFSMCVIGPR